MREDDAARGLIPAETNIPLDQDECTACGRIVDMKRLLKTPLGYYICEASQECIAYYSGWERDPVEQEGK